MEQTLGIDIGTSAVKVSPGNAGMPQRMVGGTPISAVEIASIVRGLAEERLAAVSSFRRAAVVDGRLEMVRDRMSRSFPHRCQGKTARNTRFSTASAYGPGVQFELFEAWLARELCGEPVVSQRVAWLSGLWDRGTGDWCPDCLMFAGLHASGLPRVTNAETQIGRWVLPFLCDHEATLLCVQREYPEAGALLEMGSASASLVSSSGSFLGINVLAMGQGEQPWSEVIRPGFSRQLAAGDDAADLLRDHVAHIRDGGHTRVVVSGGNVTPEIRAALDAAKLDVITSTSVGSCVGARLTADKLRDATKASI